MILRAVSVHQQMRSLGYEPYDKRLPRLTPSLVVGLTWVGLRHQVVSDLLRLPWLSLSRSVSCTNPCTDPVPELRAQDRSACENGYPEGGDGDVVWTHGITARAARCR